MRDTIHRHNVHDLEATARLLLEELGLSGFSTNAAGYLGTCRLNAEVLLTAQERQLAMATLLCLAAKYPGRIQAAAGPLAEGRMWARMEKARAERRVRYKISLTPNLTVSRFGGIFGTRIHPHGGNYALRDRPPRHRTGVP